MYTAHVNATLLAVFSDLTRHAGSARVTVSAGLQWRSLEISNGELRGADSNLPHERIGQILVEIGWLDSALVEPILKESLANRHTLGAQLLVDGLTDSTKIADGLRLQCLRRFEAALTMDGTVAQEPHKAGLGGLQRPLGAAILAAFREPLPLEVMTNLLQAPPPARVPPADRAQLADKLEMSGAEARLWRRITKGESPQALLSGSGGDKAVWRFLAALLALGLIEWR